MLSGRMSKSVQRGVLHTCRLPSSSTSSTGRASGKPNLQLRFKPFSSVSSFATRQEHKDTQFYVATLPWSVKDEDRKERFNSLIKNARLTENDNIVASSITTSKRASPIASSLKAEIDHLNSTASQGGGAWLLLKADNEKQAEDLLKELKVDQVFDLNKATLQPVHLQQEASPGGPLYDDSKAQKTNDNASSSSQSSASSSSSASSAAAVSETGTEGPRLDTLETIFGDKTAGGGKSSSTSSSSSSQSSGKTDNNTGGGSAPTAGENIGGHSLETNGPLYGK